MTTFFGPRWDAPLVGGATPAPTPTGQICYSCSEQIVDGDRGLLRHTVRLDEHGQPCSATEPVHAECDLLSVIGHQVGVVDFHPGPMILVRADDGRESPTRCPRCGSSRPLGRSAVCDPCARLDDLSGERRFGLFHSRLTPG